MSRKLLTKYRTRRNKSTKRSRMSKRTRRNKSTKRSRRSKRTRRSKRSRRTKRSKRTRRSRRTKRTRRSRRTKRTKRSKRTRRSKIEKHRTRSRRFLRNVKNITKAVNILQDKLLVDINPSSNEGLKEIKDIVKAEEKNKYVHDRKFKNKNTALEDINILTNKLKNIMYDKTLEISSGLKKILYIFGSNKTIKVLSSLLILLLLILSTYKSVDYSKIKTLLITIIDKIIDILMLFVPEEYLDDMVNMINTGTVYAVGAGKDLIINTTHTLGKVLINIAGKSIVLVVPILFEATVNILLTMMQQGATGTVSMVIVTVYLLKSLRNMLV